MVKKPTKKELEKLLSTQQKEYEAIQGRIQGIGFICKGSIVERHLPCGNKNCRCRKDKEKWHGPYYQLSWKEKGKTVSHFIPPETRQIYQEWIDNYQMLMDIIDEMLATSREAGDCLRKKKGKSGNDKAKTKKKEK